MPEGKAFIVVHVTSGDWRMTRMGQVLVAGEEPQRFGEALGRIRFPGTHADGRPTAFNSGQQKLRPFDLWMTQNSLPLLKA